MAGTVDVIVNNPQEGQPWCKEPNKALCSHASANDIFISAITDGPLLATKEITNEILYGFPLEVPIEITGIYHLNTNDIDNIPQVPPHTWPREPDGYVWPVINPNFTNGYDADDIKLIGMSSDDSYEKLFTIYKPTNFFVSWVQQNPYSELIIIITEEEYTDWAVNLRKTLLSLPDHKYVLIVDWSMYVFNSHRFTASYAQLVAYTLSDWMNKASIDTSKTEIIGFSTSGHVAGLVGHYQRESGSTVQRIVALDPAAYGGWSHPMQIEKLTVSSAQVVQVIHTNTKNYGYLEPLGLYDIYVNGGDRQPICEFDDFHADECSHQTAIKYYIESISVHAIATEATLQNGVAVISGIQTVCFGYWLIPNRKITANVFVLETLGAPDEQTGTYITPSDSIPTDSQQIDPTDINGWPPFIPDVQMPQDAQKLLFNIYYKEGATEKNTVARPPGRIPKANGLLQIFSGLGSTSQIIMIINGEHDKDHNWAVELKDTIRIIAPQSVVIIVDWSIYKYNSYITTARFVKSIGYTIANALYIANAPTNLLHIIGYSLGSHIAGFIGKESRRMYDHTIYRITGLDPSRAMFYHESVTESNRLTRTDASFVDVIHTNTVQFGFPAPIGHVDFFVNGGKSQPGCLEGTDIECAHKRSIYYFMESIVVRTYALKVMYQDESKLIFMENTQFTTFGYFANPYNQGSFYIKTQGNKPYLKSPNTARPPESITAGLAGTEDSLGAGNGNVLVPGESMGYPIDNGGINEVNGWYGTGDSEGSFGGIGSHEASGFSPGGTIDGGSNGVMQVITHGEPEIESDQHVYFDQGPVETDFQEDVLILPGPPKY